MTRQIVDHSADIRQPPNPGQTRQQETEQTLYAQHEHEQDHDRDNDLGFEID